MKKTFYININNNSIRSSLYFCIFLLFFTACNDNTTLPDDDNLQLKTLVGTKWKFIGFTEESTGNISKIDSEYDCNNCFTLKFENDSLIAGFTTVNDLHIIYTANYKENELTIFSVFGTKVNESEIGKKYIDIFTNMTYIKPTKYLATEKNLKIFYDNNNKYLNYYRIKDNTFK